MCSSSVSDPTLSVAIGGDIGEARALQRSTQPEQSGRDCVASGEETLCYPVVTYPVLCVLPDIRLVPNSLTPAFIACSMKAFHITSGIYLGALFILQPTKSRECERDKAR